MLPVEVSLYQRKSLPVLFAALLLIRKSCLLLINLLLWQHLLSSHYCFQACSDFLFLSHWKRGHGSHPFVSNSDWLMPVTFRPVECDSDGSVLRWISVNSTRWNDYISAAFRRLAWGRVEVRLFCRTSWNWFNVLMAYKTGPLPQTPE